MKEKENKNQQIIITSDLFGVSETKEKSKNEMLRNLPNLDERLFSGFTFEQLRKVLLEHKTGQIYYYPIDLYGLFTKHYSYYIQGVTAIKPLDKNNILLNMLVNFSSVFMIYELIEKKEDKYVITDLGKTFIAQSTHKRMFR